MSSIVQKGEEGEEEKKNLQRPSEKKLKEQR
jgi:hypothetical protein